ncbi:hypothetical protein BJI49_06590 [Acetobacter pasteurianus]|nr:hypothetical protein BJI49_06590 [Acetobacter pasteurianus]
MSHACSVILLHAITLMRCACIRPTKKNIAAMKGVVRKMIIATLPAADAATKSHIVPHNIPAERMRMAKNTLYCWKGGAFTNEDAISMIVCGVANPPLKEGRNG